jgi:signal peptidase II
MRRLNLRRVKWYLIIFSIALGLVIIDRLSKLWIQSHLLPGQSWPSAGFFRLTYAQNTGAAFSIFYGKSDILAVVSIIGVVLILAYVFAVYRRFTFLCNRINNIALGMILGGDIGNLIDRLAFGHVTDFVDIGPWPVFNVADMSLVCGVFVFAFSILLVNQETQKTHHM